MPEGWADYALTATHTGTSYAACFRTNSDRLFPDLPEDTAWASGASDQRIFILRRARLVVAVANETDHKMDLGALNRLVATAVDTLHIREPPMPAAVRNVAREKLEQGQLSLGVGVRITRSVEIAKAMAVAGFDWLFLDMEHGVMSLEPARRSRRRRSMPASRLSRACRTANTRSPHGRWTMARSASSCRMSIAPPKQARW